MSHLLITVAHSCLQLYYHPAWYKEETGNEQTRDCNSALTPYKPLASHDNTRLYSRHSGGRSRIGCPSSRRARDEKSKHKACKSGYCSTACNPALRKQRQENFNFSDCLGCMQKLTRKGKINSCKFTLPLFLLLQIK